MVMEEIKQQYAASKLKLDAVAQRIDHRSKEAKKLVQLVAT